jgi:hypothetical protein
VWVVVLHTGVRPPQFALLVHSTHTYVVPLSKQTGSAGGHSAFVVHCAHCPPCGFIATQCGCSGAVHSMSVTHARHVSSPGVADLSQMGVGVFGLPSQLALPRHATHWPTFGSPPIIAQ